MAVTKEQVVEFIENMSVIELSGFVKELEEKFGVSAAAPAAAVVVAAPAEEVKEEKTSFDVVLSSVGDKKVTWRVYTCCKIHFIGKSKHP